MVILKFVNHDAADPESAVTCGSSDVALIVAWYSAYNAGDRYEVYIDGVKQALDLDGRIKG